jgi:hypothetical protein
MDQPDYWGISPKPLAPPEPVSVSSVASEAAMNREYERPTRRGEPVRSPVMRAGGASELHPWKLRLVDGDWQVYGTGATVEKRWTGDTHTVTGLDSDLTLGVGDNYIYARATVSSGVLSDFIIDVESAALDRVVSAGGEQTELNVLIGSINGDSAIQRLRDPVNVTLACVAGVPAWVPLLSEGVIP